MRNSIPAFVLAAVTAAVGAPYSAAEPFDDPNKLAVEDADGTPLKTFTIDELKTDFTQRYYETRTPWTEKNEKVGYRGPLLKDVLAKTGLDKNSAIEVVAYDNFVSEIHMDEIRSYGPILAVERQCTDDDRAQGRCMVGQNFRPIDIIEKGPIFVVWPFDRLPSTYFPARNSIWVFFPVVLRAEQ